MVVQVYFLKASILHLCILHIYRLFLILYIPYYTLLPFSSYILTYIYTHTIHYIYIPRFLKNKTVSELFNLLSSSPSPSLRCPPSALVDWADRARWTLLTYQSTLFYTCVLLSSLNYTISRCTYIAVLSTWFNCFVSWAALYRERVSVFFDKNVHVSCLLFSIYTLYIYYLGHTPNSALTLSG